MTPGPPGAVGGDGCLYFPPPQALRVLRIDPTTQAVEQIGDELGEGFKWNGAFPSADGCVYGVPYGDKQLLRIDPATGTATRVGPPLQDSHVTSHSPSIPEHGVPGLPLVAWRSKR